MKGGLYTVSLSDEDDNLLINKDIMLTLSNTVNSKVYNVLTDINGSFSLQINLNIGNYTITVKYNGDDVYSASSLTNNIEVVSDDTIYISSNMANSDIQQTLDSSDNYSNIVFTDSIYNNVSLVISKPLNILSNGSILYGVDAPVFSVESSDVNISGLNLIPFEGTGVLVNNSVSVKIINCTISNILDSNYSYEYSRGYKVLPGDGVSIVNSSNVLVEGNNISNFENGVYLLDSNHVNITDNILMLDNYGVNYDYGVSDTLVFNNNITLNVGNYTLDEPEGPLGYGIYLNNSAVNCSIYYNNIVDNYIGILIDSENSTGIRIISNLVNENALEGITFWKHYNLTDSSVYPVVEDNAIYNNAKGPSMMILGEMSANPEGIYGPGEWNDDLKLFIGPNWYGVNHLVTWDLDGTVGAGSMCPRIKTSTIIMNLSYKEPGVYDVEFYKNGSLAVNLPVFTVYSTFNNISSSEPVVIINGSGELVLDENLFNSDYNLIEVSAGPLDSSDRVYYVIYNYLIPISEYP